jgi:hypothetical protein
LGYKYGAVSEERYKKFCALRHRFDTCKQALEGVEMPLQAWKKYFPNLPSVPKGKICRQT